MIYNKIVYDCFFYPRHVGTIDPSQVDTIMVRNEQKGQALIEFYLQHGQDRGITRACFKTNGNPFLVAGLEWLCRRIEGRIFDEIDPLDYQLLVNELAIPVTQYPLALRIVAVFKESLILMNNRLSHRGINYE